MDGKSAGWSAMAVHILQLASSEEISLPCLQISLGAFSDLSAFEIQSIAQTHTGVSILGEALQVRAIHAYSVCLQCVLYNAHSVLHQCTSQPESMHGSLCSYFVNVSHQLK